MKKTILLLTLLALNAQASVENIEVVYGDDNRHDLYEVRNPMFLKLAKSTAGMIPKERLRKRSDGTLQLTDKKSLADRKNVCPDERFSQQVTAPECSGFLVGPDLLVTAGHCYFAMGNPEGDCRDNVWVFDYAIDRTGKNPASKILTRDVYECKKIVAGKYDRLGDYTLIQLDRKVLGRQPLQFRQRGILPAATPLVVMGHPSGLPLKISDKASVTKNANKNTFSTTLDTFQGNSGSGVFNSRTGLLEGILIQGKTDYLLKDKNNPNSCYVLNVCDNRARNCSAGDETGSIAKGEVVLRIDVIKDVIQRALEQE
jgi:V8-like Glu-specific endopeptidase